MTNLTLPRKDLSSIHAHNLEYVILLRFFSNTGAVAGVFVLVGLAAASICLWIFFAVRRRRRAQRREHDSAVAASVAAAAFHRAPLDEDEDGYVSTQLSRFGSGDVEMSQPSSSRLGMVTPSVGRAPSSTGFRDLTPEDLATPTGSFNPYADYVSIPTANGPPQASYTTPRSDSPAVPYLVVGASNPDERQRRGHTASSSGSYEPLLAAYYRPSSSPSPQVPGTPPPPPPRNPQRLIPKTASSPPPPFTETPSRASSVYSSEQSIADDRLDPGLRQRMKNEMIESSSSIGPRDDEDYSRPVLGVRSPSAA
jgi:hypothetical protein